MVRKGGGALAARQGSVSAPLYSARSAVRSSSQASPAIGGVFSFILPVERYDSDRRANRRDERWQGATVEVTPVDRRHLCAALEGTDVSVPVVSGDLPAARRPRGRMTTIQPTHSVPPRVALAVTSQSPWRGPPTRTTLDHGVPGWISSHTCYSRSAAGFGSASGLFGPPVLEPLAAVPIPREMVAAVVLPCLPGNTMRPDHDFQNKGPSPRHSRPPVPRARNLRNYRRRPSANTTGETAVWSRDVAA